MLSLGKSDLEKFNGQNDFNLWRIKMKAWLVHQGLFDAIQRDRVEIIANMEGPRIGEARDVLSKAHSTLLLSLGDEVLWEVVDEETTIGLWEKLENLFLRKTLANRLILKKQLYTLEMGESKDLKRHLDDFNKIILDLRSVDVRIEEEDQAIILLSSLPKTYENIVDTMLYGKETLTMADVKSVLNSKDVQMKNAETGSSKSDVLIVRGRADKKWNKKGSRNRSKSKTPGRCFHCKREGHWKRDCPDRKQGSKPHGEASYVVNDEEENAEVLVVSSGKHDKEWILDSGCSFHMCPFKEWFEELKPSNGEVLLGDDESCQITGIGNISLLMFDGCIRQLKDVRLVPSLKRNLISVGTLDASGHQIRIHGGTIKVIKGIMTLMKGTMGSNGLYILEGKIANGMAAIADSKFTSRGSCGIKGWAT